MFVLAYRILQQVALGFLRPATIKAGREGKKVVSGKLK